MQLDNTEEIRMFLINIDNLFSNLDNIKRELEKQIKIKEDIVTDYLHELELSKLNGIEIMKISKELIKTRRERRILKDKLEFINTLKGYTDKYITKGIIADTKQAISNIDTLVNNHKIREYTPKVIKDLKCAKKKD